MLPLEPTKMVGPDICGEVSEPATEEKPTESGLNRVSGLRASQMKFDTWVIRSVQEIGYLS